MVENAKIEKFKWDIFGDFWTMCTSLYTSIHSGDTYDHSILFIHLSLQQRSIFGPKTQSIVVIICRELKIWLLLILSWKMYANTAVSSQSGYFFLLFGSFFVIASFWHETNLFDVTHSKVQHTDQFAFREQ